MSYAPVCPGFSGMIRVANAHCVVLGGKPLIQQCVCSYSHIPIHPIRFLFGLRLLATHHFQSSRVEGELPCYRPAVCLVAHPGGVPGNCHLPARQPCVVIIFFRRSLHHHVDIFVVTARAPPPVRAVDFANL